MIKAIIFDIGGVICPDIYAENIDTFCKWYRTDKKKLHQAWYDHWNDWKYNKIDGLQFFSKISKDLNTPIDPKKIIEATFDMIWIDNDLLDYIKNLKDHRLAILSNNTEEWVSYQKKQFGQIFDIWTTSDQESCGKPDPAIYLTCIDRLQIPADQCLFIDNTQENLDTAEKLGMKTILYKNFNNLKEKMKEFL
ncbi:HAD-IA family hydrolase [Nanoarchaeota archaeon]